MPANEKKIQHLLPTPKVKFIELYLRKLDQFPKPGRNKFKPPVMPPEPSGYIKSRKHDCL